MEARGSLAAGTAQPTERVEAAGGTYVAFAPTWGRWRQALDRAAEAERDPGLLLEQCLLAGIRSEDGGELDEQRLRQMPSADGDRMLSVILGLIERQREELAIAIDRAEASSKLTTAAGGRYRVRGWSFGERNDALREAMRLHGDKVLLDLNVYERRQLAICVSAEGEEPADPSGWPIALGEAVMAELDRLNGAEPDRDRLLAACVRHGIDHPDLALARLCGAFGWTPEQAEGLSARTGERLAAALRALSRHGAEPARPAADAGGFEPAREAGSADVGEPGRARDDSFTAAGRRTSEAAPGEPRSASGATPSYAYAAEGVTRIVVQDD